MFRVLLRPFHALNAEMRAHPFKTCLVVTTVKAGLADLMVQQCIERRTEVDRRRMCTFVLFGAAYQGCFQYWMFNVLFERLFPGSGMAITLKRVLVTNLVGDPIFFFPVFYTMREALATPPGETFQLDSVRSALSKYRSNCWEDWRNTWAVWFPCHMVTHGLCPPHLRMPWVAGISFGYLSLLSWTRGAVNEPVPLTHDDGQSHAIDGRSDGVEGAPAMVRPDGVGEPMREGVTSPMSAAMPSAVPPAPSPPPETTSSAMSSRTGRCVHATLSGTLLPQHS